MAVTDAYVILRQMDQFVLVVRANVTKKGALKRSIEYKTEVHKGENCFMSWRI